LRSDRRPLVILLGPTGVGKTAAAVELSLRFEGEIINADSMQVYRGFDIGTAKPSPEDRRRVPHHLVDIVDPRSQFSAAEFVALALDALRLIDDHGHLPLFVGGTGLYLKALTDGLFPGPGRDESLRAKLESEARESGLEGLRQKLERVDPKYAAAVGPRDRVRIVRALEVYELTGRPISENFSETTSPVSDRRLIRIGLAADRPALYARINARVEGMFRAGLVGEVRRLLDEGVPEAAPPFKALGYKQVVRHLAGEIPLEEAVRLTKLDTRHFAKRQMTWFRKMAGVRWFEAEDRAGWTDYLGSELAER
jgi:tRNA dimethylallyltransferase